MSCDVCKGVGRCPVCRDEPDYEICEYCNGQGKVFLFCRSVEDDVWIQIPKNEYVPGDEYEEETCHVCNGEGRREIEPDEGPTNYFSL